MQERSPGGALVTHLGPRPPPSREWRGNELPTRGHVGAPGRTLTQGRNQVQRFPDGRELAAKSYKMPANGGGGIRTLVRKNPLKRFSRRPCSTAFAPPFWLWYYDFGRTEKVRGGRGNAWGNEVPGSFASRSLGSAPIPHLPVSRRAVSAKHGEMDVVRRVEQLAHGAWDRRHQASFAFTSRTAEISG
jgi:hypothetical protein